MAKSPEQKAADAIVKALDNSSVSTTVVAWHIANESGPVVTEKMYVFAISLLKNWSVHFKQGIVDQITENADRAYRSIVK